MLVCCVFCLRVRSPAATHGGSQPHVCDHAELRVLFVAIRVARAQERRRAHVAGARCGLFVQAHQERMTVIGCQSKNIRRAEGHRVRVKLDNVQQTSSLVDRTKLEERKSICLFMYLSNSFEALLESNEFIKLPIYVSMYLWIYIDIVCYIVQRSLSAVESNGTIKLSVYVFIYLWIYISSYIRDYIHNGLFDVCMHLSIYLSIYISIYRSIHLYIYLFIYLSIYLSIYRSIYRSVDRSIDLSIYPSTYLSIDISIDRSIYRSTNGSIDVSIDLSIDLSIYTYIYIYIRVMGRARNGLLNP